MWDLTKEGADGALLWSKSFGHTFGAAFDPQGQLLVTTTNDRELFVHDARSGEELDRLELAAGADYDVPFTMTFSPDGSRLYAGTLRGVVYEFAIER